jgi:hypothetical protein
LEDDAIALPPRRAQVPLRGTKRGTYALCLCRDANARGKSLTIVVLPREDAVAAAPSIEELIRIARLDN